MTRTAVTALTEALEAAQRHQAPVVALSHDEAGGVLARLADVCGEHGACEVCDEPLCEPCGIGELSACPHHMMLCADVDCAVSGCGDCAQDVADDADAELYERGLR